MENKSQKFFLIMASSTNHMLRGEKLLREAGIETALVPAPSEYGSVCAIAIRVSERVIQEAKDILTQYNIRLSGIYEDIPKKLSGLLERVSNQIISKDFLSLIRLLKMGHCQVY